MIEIRVLRAGDDAVLRGTADDVFDDALNELATREFLNDPRHHLVVAVDEGTVVGFASAVHYVHPDKPAPELWINEVGVASSHHRRGIGRRIVAEMLRVGRELGCSVAWVLTESDNHAAKGLYKISGGAEAPPGTVMFEFDLTDEPASE